MRLYKVLVIIRFTVVDNDGNEQEVVVMVRDRCGEWTLPTGGIKRNELPEDAACREVSEETLVFDLREVADLGKHRLKSFVASPEVKKGGWNGHFEYIPYDVHMGKITSQAANEYIRLFMDRRDAILSESGEDTCDQDNDIRLETDRLAFVSLDMLRVMTGVWSFVRLHVIHLLTPKPREDTWRKTDVTKYTRKGTLKNVSVYEVPPMVRYARAAT